MDLQSLLPLVFTLLAGGGLVAIYLARANKDSVNVKASLDAVTVINTTLRVQEKALITTREELGVARERIAVLEAERDELRRELRETREVSHECRRRIVHLSEAIRRLGGTVDDAGDLEDRADA